MFVPISFTFLCQRFYSPVAIESPLQDVKIVCGLHFYKDINDHISICNRYAKIAFIPNESKKIIFEYI